MITQGAVITVINAVIVSNITLNAEKYNAQIDEFLVKSTLIPNFNLTHVLATDILNYISENKVDLCLFWDKDIYLAGAIKAMGVRVFNNIAAIYRADDKALTALKLQEHNVEQPPFFVFPETFGANVFAYYEMYKKDLLALRFPLVIKHRHGSFGEQVFQAKNEEELKEIIEREGKNKLIAQSYITKEFGVDYRVNVVGDEVVAVIKRHNKDDFRSNINRGGKFFSVEKEELHQIAIAATKALSAHFAGVDIVLDQNDKPYVIEVNSNMRTVTINEKSATDVTLAILKYIAKK